jgi:hypothetical protein
MDVMPGIVPWRDSEDRGSEGAEMNTSTSARAGGARRPLVAIACALAMMAWLTAPTAWAGPPEGKGQPDHAQGEDNRNERASEQGENGEQGAAHGQEDNGQGAEQSEGKNPEETPPPHAGGEGNGKGEGPPDETPPPHAKGEGKPEGDGDDNGDVEAQQEDNDLPNRGSVKVHDGDVTAVAEDVTPHMEPHVGCDFTILFYGFAAVGADVTINAHPPTVHDNDGRVPLYTEGIGFSNGGDKRGNELNHAEHVEVAHNVDGELTFVGDWGALEGIEPHPQQGWHVKLHADGWNTVGGEKQKVFWIDCPVPVAEVLPEEEVPEEVVPEEEVPEDVPDEEVLDEEDVDVEDVDDEILAAVEVAEEEDEVLGVAEELPVTGQNVLLFALLALALLGTGGAILLLTRRGDEPIG